MIMGNYKLELISIHIPKTGGTSFRLVLEEVYGKKNIQQWYSPARHNESIVLDKSARVLHGHISLKIYRKLVSDYPFCTETPVITWIRDPVERLISEYYYFYNVISDQLSSYMNKTPGLKNRMVRTLIEYARFYAKRNMYPRYLSPGWAEKGQLLFVGQTEQFQDDIIRLSKIMDWNSVPYFDENQTKEKKELSDHEQSIVLSSVRQDSEIYQKLLKNQLT